MENTSYRFKTKLLVTTGVLIGISVILRSYLAIMIPIGGAPSMRISLDRIFYVLPGLLFSPVYGAIAGGAADIIAFIIKPSGPFIPLFTLTTIFAGYLPAIIWNSLKKIDTRKLQLWYKIIFIFIGTLGILNYILLAFLPKSSISLYILSTGKKAQYVSIGLILTSIVGLLLYLVNSSISKKRNLTFLYDNYLKLIIALGITAILVCTINTYLLRIYLPALSSKAFMLLWLPRIAETLFIVPIEAYLLSILISIYTRNQ